jgi:hypothetical protein
MFRAEYLVRRTDMDTDDADAFKYAIASEGGSFFVKHGAYVEVEAPLTGALDLIVRGDGLLRVGNVAAGSLLSNRSWMVRETLGLALGVTRNLRIKSSVETYEFSDADANGQKGAVGIHLAAVATF